MKTLVGIILCVVIIVVSCFAIIKHKNKTKKDKTQNEQTGDTDSKEVETERIHTLTDHEETYSIPRGYRVEFSERPGKLYYLKIDDEEVIVGDGVYDEFGNYQTTYSLRKHESDKSETEVTVWLKPF